MTSDTRIGRTDPASPNLPLRAATAAESLGAPVFLELDGAGLFGVLHSPPERACRGAVLICPPFGWAAVCAHRGLRAWAVALAKAGYMTLRFDLPGSGDSSGSPQDPDRVGAWISSTTAAGRWLRTRAGVQRLSLIGLGIGGLVTLGAMAAGLEADEVILWGTPARGRRAVRELRAIARFAVPTEQIGAIPPQDGAAETEAQRPKVAADGSLEVTGYLVTAETLDALGRLIFDEGVLNGSSARRALLLDRDGVGVDPELPAALGGAGMSVDRAHGQGWARLMDHPQQSAPPAATIRRTLDWLDAGQPTRATAERSDTPTAAVLVPALKLASGPATLVERALALDWRGVTLNAIVTEPAEAQAALCVVWLGAGALRRCGPNRAWTEAARRWANHGIPCVRVDLAGVGESGGEVRSPLPDADLYARTRTEQTLAVLDGLVAQGLPGRFVLGGLCSGAYQSVQAAKIDRRVIGLLLVNLYAFEWEEALVRERETAHAVGALGRRAWQRLRRGDLSRAEIARALASLRPARLREAAGHPTEFAQRGRVLETLELLRARDVKALLLFSDGEPLQGQLERLGVLGSLDRWPNLSVSQIPSRDHMFRAIELQAFVHARLDAAVYGISTDG